MSQSFTALVIDKKADGSGTQAGFRTLTTADLPPGEVLVKISHSTVNYKDGLALTGRSPVVRSFPMVGGIDFAGSVVESASAEVEPGQRVIVNGWGLSESRWGGYAGYARVDAKHLVPLPASLTPADAMAIGTAGYTAMLAVLALEKAGLAPSAGDVLVTGAAGGVGSVAIALLAGLGYRVIASTGRPEEAPFLIGLGAAEIIARSELSAPGKPLGKERWAGAVDSVGSHTLANVLAGTRYGGAVAACGLAQGMDLPGSVAPFILRGIALLGIDSVMAPKAKRLEAWGRLAADLDLDKLKAITSFAPMAELPALAEQILAGRIRGRVVVEIGG